MKFSLDLSKRFYIFWTDMGTHTVAADTCDTIEEALEVAQLRVLFGTPESNALITDTQLQPTAGCTKQITKFKWSQGHILQYNQLPYAKWELQCLPTL